MASPRRAKLKKSDEKADFPTVFYRSVPAGKLSESPAEPMADSEPDLKKRRLLMWLGVGLVMAVLIGLWTANLPERLKSFNLASAKKDIFQNPAATLSDLFREGGQNTASAEEIIKKILKQALPSPTAGSEGEKIQELKKNIENKYESEKKN